MADHDKWRQRFDQLIVERQRELGREPPREDVRAILNQIDRERAAEQLKVMVASADVELDDDDLAILGAMGEDNDNDNDDDSASR